MTAATWQWSSLTDAELQGQRSISLTLVIAANLTATAGGSVSTPASAASAEEARASQTPGKRPRGRKERREREAVEREKGSLNNVQFKIHHRQFILEINSVFCIFASPIFLCLSIYP